MVAKEPTKGLVEELRESSTLIKSLSGKFSEHTKSIKVVTCHELLETPTMQCTNGVWKRTGLPEMMVNESSACTYLPNETSLPINANHSMIAKLPDSQGSEYHDIKDYLIAHCAAAPTAVQRRLLKQGCAVALSEVEKLADFVCWMVRIVKKEANQAMDFKRQMPHELSFLEAFGGFLVDDELGAILDDQRLSAGYPQRISGLLQELKTTFSSFSRLAMKYHEPYWKAVQHISTRNQEREGLNAPAPTPLNERFLQDPEVSDGLFSEDSLHAILRKCRTSTQKLKESLSFATLCSLRLGTKEEMDLYLVRNEIRATDLAPIVKRQYLIQNQSMRKPEPLRGNLADIQPEERNPDLRLMQFYRQEDKGAETVIVEYRRYEPEPRHIPGRTPQAGQIAHENYLKKVKTTMRNLAGLLYDLSSEVNDDSNEDRASSPLNFFQCLGFLEESKHCRFTFLFRIPTELSFDSAMRLRSLSSYIENFKKSHATSQRTPQLEERFSLAYNICQAVLNLHSYGWVHKSIRSPNIILVPRNPDAAAMHSQENFQYLTPYLTDFEFSRPQQDNSSRSAQFDAVPNLYRHPARQDDPTEGFNKEHDLYAVGVVLLEIGMWKTVSTVFKSQVAEARPGNAKKVRDQMMTLAETRLPPEMGTRYAEAVKMCVGGFGIVEDDKHQTNLGLAFRQQVLDLLEAGLKL